MKSVFSFVFLVALMVSALLQDQASGQEQDNDFTMEVADHFSIADGGVVITGVIASGTVSVDDTICLNSKSVGQRQLKVAGIEMFRKVLDSASAGDQVGLLVAGAEQDDIAEGDMLTGACQ
jgi:translation elongation factor EF-Tu-like GTPase